MKNKKLVAIIAAAVVVVAVVLIAIFVPRSNETGKNDLVDATPTQAPATSTDTTTGQSEKPLVVGYQPFSQKFSPFFAQTGYDQDVVSLTHVELLTTDRSGGIVYNAIEGETRTYNGNEHFYNGIADIKVTYDEKEDITTYYIKIRDDVKFSDGHVMDADDIIFTYYVLADPTYTGYTTLYSYDIIGMKNYRLNNSMAEQIDVTADEVKAELANPSAETTEAIKQFVADTLTSELEWVKSLYGNPSYAEYTEKYPNAKDLFAYFYSIDENYDSSAVADESQVLADIIAQYGDDWKALGNNYGGSETYFQADIESKVKDVLLNKKLAVSGGTEVDYIEGIKKLSQTEVEVKCRGFEAPAVYTICGIWVAPLHYYGDESMYDYENHKFGFPKGDLSIIESKTTQPMGAGPYKFIKYENKVVYLEANENYYKGAPKIKYLQLKETTDGEMINGVATGVIDLANPSGSVAKMNEIKKINSNGQLTGDVITSSLVDNLGYGYIGINADNVNVGGDPGSEASKNLRKAFATLFAVYRDVAIDSYYADAATVINYPISSTSWAAPQKTDEGYEVAYSKDVNGNPIYTADMVAEDKYEAALQAAIGYFKAAGYTFDESTGKFVAAPEGAKMKYEVMIPADGVGDHPAFSILKDTQAALEKIGITLEINDLTDANELWDSINANTHEMWAAAWGATIDPDMYQVYHSSNRIGRGGTDSNSYNINDPELDQIIMEARRSPDQAYRKALYKRALDIILDWGVVIPTYQRQNLVIFSTQRINTDTITPDISTYYEWFREIEKMEMR
ncbi:ABC transporter substrate-binding protein [Thermoclostridium stercorarium subsp. thermolacticum DSM 2910]|uniref:ABC transporter substrate-binding protein n=1 Tax=Thermoclostridium stercorarium subsp. thermolacticum DSM 2910 TaxID=1121336 RepID=A0A1B1YBQ0_THEST|nr:ABC transporter substrate-binding protein [Thermoclostridium stercorarium]ANW98168.1 ABC transporter substrate-binding protein [Thermoclostridium stercorarium subsp. thermolacticum DSM 2910]